LGFREQKDKIFTIKGGFLGLCSQLCCFVWNITHIFI